MQTHPYIWAALCVLAVVGFAMAMYQDLKPSTLNSNLHWVKWIGVFTVLVMFDVLMLTKPWDWL